MAPKPNPTPSNLHKGLQAAAKRRVEQTQRGLNPQFDAGATKPPSMKNAKNMNMQ